MHVCADHEHDRYRNHLHSSGNKLEEPVVISRKRCWGGRGDRPSGAAPTRIAVAYDRAGTAIIPQQNLRKTNSATHVQHVVRHQLSHANAC